jgi:8-oxo-dGTP pyrophosphatase MutT (NUDIX family)
MISSHAPMQKVVFDTPWFQIVERNPPDYLSPHYSLQTRDYVGIIAIDLSGCILLVRQFRPTLWEKTLEIPSGHVEEGQKPEEAARIELYEETGHEVDRMELLCDLSPDTGRIGNRMWCFFAGNARPTSNPNYQPEAGVDFVRYESGVRDLLQEKEFCSALNRAALFAAVEKGKIAL